MKSSKIATILLLTCLSACWNTQEEDKFEQAAAPKVATEEEKAAAAKAAADALAKAAAAAVSATRVFKDTDFTEAEQNRDPFRSFVSDMLSKGPMVAQRTVLMPNTPIDDMRLIAIITGIDQPRAMIVDEQGVGYVTT